MGSRPCLTTFRVRSPKAAAYLVFSPGELGIGRAYVSGEVEVDDLDAAVDLVREWQPPKVDKATKAKRPSLADFLTEARANGRAF